jgi:hypothetical protein
MQGPDEKIASAARDGALGPRGEERRGEEGYSAIGRWNP